MPLHPLEILEVLARVNVHRKLLVFSIIGNIIPS